MVASACSVAVPAVGSWPRLVDTLEHRRSCADHYSRSQRSDHSPITPPNALRSLSKPPDHLYLASTDHYPITRSQRSAKRALRSVGWIRSLRPITAIRSQSDHSPITYPIARSLNTDHSADHPITIRSHPITLNRTRTHPNTPDHNADHPITT